MHGLPEQRVLFFLTLVERKINNFYSLNHDLLVGLLRRFLSLLVCVTNCRVFFSSRLSAVLLLSVTQYWKSAVESILNQLNIYLNNTLFLDFGLLNDQRNDPTNTNTQSENIREYWNISLSKLTDQFDMFININILPSNNHHIFKPYLKPNPKVSKTKP